MFNRSRRKIVFAVVGSLLALMAVTLTTIVLSNRAARQRENREMLQTYVERFTLSESAEPMEDKPDNRPDGKPGGPDGREPGKNEPAFRLSTFYAVAYSASGEVLAVDNGNAALQSEESLLALASAVLTSGKKSGTMEHMTYLVEKRGDYTLVAMIDGTLVARDQATLIRQMLMVGLPALAVLVGIAMFLARRIMRPLEENDSRQKRFISDAGHELKTPVAVIAANSELLRRQIGENEWLDNIDYENERMGELIRQLLTLCRTEAGDLPQERLDFSLLVSGETLPFESLAYDKGRRIEAHVEPGLTVKGNAGQLRQVVSVLLDNALSHGCGEIIELTLRREKHAAVLSVANEAAAIDPDKLMLLFDRFYRTDEARGDASAHYGLGLSIAKAAVTAHGGDIRAEYRDGKMIFWVTIPTVKADA